MGIYLMNIQLPLNTDYQAVRAQFEDAIGGNLAEKEAEWLSKLPDEVSDELRGGYVQDTASLMSLFTPEYYAECVDNYEGNITDPRFYLACIQEMNEKIAYLALTAWPNAIDRDAAWVALSYPLGNQWADRVSIKGKDNRKTSKRVPILNAEVVPTLSSEHCFYLYANGDIVALVPAWEGITEEDIRSIAEEHPTGYVDAVYIPILHEQGTRVSTKNCWVDAETDDEALLDIWGSSTSKPRFNRVDEGHDFFVVYDEKDDGKPEMTKRFKLLFDVPITEVQGFTASLKEAGFSQVISRPIKVKPTLEELPEGAVRNADGSVNWSSDITEIAPTIPTPMTVDYLVEVFSNKYTKDQVEGLVERVGLEDCRQMAEHHASLRYSWIGFSEQ